MKPIKQILSFSKKTNNIKKENITSNELKMLFRKNRFRSKSMKSVDVQSYSL